LPDWLSGAFTSDAEVSMSVLLLRQTLAFVLGCVVALIYWLTHAKQPRRAGGPAQPVTMMATLVLLTVLIGMIGSVVGNNVARAFSLVGALSIVRFRTVVEDTRDTAFVIFAVAVGMAVGAGYWKVPVVGVPFVALAALVFRPRTALAGIAASGAEAWLATVRLGTSFTDEGALTSALQQQSKGIDLRGISTSRQGAAVDRTYRLLMEPGVAPNVVECLNTIAGVQQVEVRRDE